MQHADSMTVFAAVVDSHGFSPAARALGIPVSTVSRTIGRLEEHLGVRLLQRTTRKVTTTETGQAYYERCKQILADIRETEEAVTRMHAEPKGRLRVTTPTAGARVPSVQNLLLAFICQYPDVELDVTMSNEYVDIVGGGYDVALRAGRLPDSSLIARKLSTTQHVLLGAKSYLDQRGRPDTLEDLVQHDLISYTGGQRTQWPLRDGGNFEVRHAKLAVNSMDLVAQAVTAGYGLSLMPVAMMCGEIRRGTVEVLLSESFGFEAALYAIYPHRRHLSAAVRAFVDFAQDHARRVSHEAESCMG